MPTPKGKTPNPRKLPPSRHAIEERIADFYRAHAFLWALVKLFRPPSRVPMSEWADAHRVLSSESSAEPGQWVTAKAPYEKEIMDAISNPLTPRVVVQKASQLGITDCAILNTVGYHIAEDPCPMLVVQPTIELAEAFSSDRLAPMIRDSPQLRAKIADPKARDSGNTLRRKAFKGGYVALGGANSAASLAGRPVRVALLDEVDRYPASAGTEGNPLQLAIARTTAFWNRKAVIVSSPGIKGVSHIEREMEQSTQEHWFLPCAECGTYQTLAWERMRFKDVTHRCSHCGKHTPKYKWLMGKGEWRASKHKDDYGNKIAIRGFYLSGLYNPWVEWEILVAEFLRAVESSKEGDIEPLKAFQNTRLGLLHEDTGDKVNVDLYRYRREVYAGEIPEGVVVLTAGVDVHEQQLNYEIVGWGRHRESWGIEYGFLDGDAREEDVWHLLDDAVYHRVFKTHDGKRMRVKKIAVDSGYASDFVYSYTKPRQPRAIAVRGEGGLGKPLIKMQSFVKTNQARLVTLGVDTGKEEIVNRLLVDQAGPGYCHFPMAADKEPTRGYDVDYFKGLTAERRIVKNKNGFKTYMWVKFLSQRNEPFDCRNYALAALSFPMSGIKLDTMERDVYEPVKGEKTGTFGAQAKSALDWTPTPPASQSGFGATNRPIQ